jgi:hypothetical protein
MADSLYLSLWFRDFKLEKMLLSALRIMQQFSTSPGVSGITSVSLHPISWNEATVLERRFRPGVSPQEAVAVAADLLHDDYAYVFAANWDLWIPEPVSGHWAQRPTVVNFIVRGEEFEEGESEAEGEIEVDFGPDTPFLYENQQLTEELDSRVRANVQTLVDFVHRAETHSGALTRLLWSESDENLAQKLVSRLQRTQ